MLTVKKRRALQKIYHDLSNPGSFSGVNPLYRESVKRKIGVSHSDVKTFLHSNDTFTVFHPAKKRFVRSKIFAVAKDDTWV